MSLTKEQKALLRAIREKKAERVRKMIDAGKVRPNFPIYATTTPLHEAVKAGSLPVLRVLIEAGADVSRPMWDGSTPEGFAKQVKARPAIIAYLEAEGEKLIVAIHPRNSKTVSRLKKNGAVKKFNSASRKPAGNKPAFTAATLPQVFSPEKWVGKTNEMQELWETVPSRLKKKFDFAASLTDARQQTLKQAPKAKVVLLKKTLKPPQP